MKEDLRFIDLFAGCGGLSLGLMQAGWTGVLAIEKEANAFETLKFNLTENRCQYNFDWLSKIPKSPISVEELVSNYAKQLIAIRNKVDVIVGGPPCQGFSMAGRRDPNDVRNSMFYQYLKIVDIVDPKIVLLENVAGFNMSFSGLSSEYKAAEFLRSGLRKLGYHVEWNAIIKARDCGAPQTRPRFFQFGIKEEYVREGKTPFDFVEEVSTKILEKKGIDESTTCKEALSDLEVDNNQVEDWEGYQKGFRKIRYSKPLTKFQKYMNKDTKKLEPNSLRLPRHTDPTKKRFQFILDNALRRNRSIDDTLRRRLAEEGMPTNKRTIIPLDPDAPSPTITTLPDDYIHYSEPRILTVRENARLQTFPDWFQFKGKYTTGGNRRKDECPRYTQVGNAVAPFVAEVMGRAVSEYVKTLNRKVRFNKSGQDQKSCR